MARPSAPGAAKFVTESADLEQLRQAAAVCQGCDLYRAATQTVFGMGDPNARVVLLGEQPGDQEDRQGLPFVGPAGKVLDRALAEAGIDREVTYVTNAVKHFKFERVEGGKRRIHQTPNRTEIVACRPWLVAELEIVGPDVMVCLGATAAKAIFGPAFRLTRERGELLPAPPLDGALWDEGTGPQVVATVHPSAVLRTQDDREAMYAGMIADLRVAA